MNRQQIIDGVSEQVIWWIGNRRRKLAEMSHETMAVNPFLAPLMLSLGDIDKFEDLAKLLLAGHFSVGHATGFGKLIDEKILPNVFGTSKLTAAFRRQRPWSMALFDEVDHVVTRGDERYLLSLKAGRWTIQLTMAVQLNATFSALVERKEAGDIDFDGIVVGVFYGTNEGLTDKYDIIRGINRGAQHDVIDLREHVDVYAGRRFWSWLNEDEDRTQEWIMDGVLNGIARAQRELGPISNMLAAYERRFTESFADYVSADGTIDWHGILRRING